MEFVYAYGIWLSFRTMKGAPIKNQSFLRKTHLVGCQLSQKRVETYMINVWNICLYLTILTNFSWHTGQTWLLASVLSIPKESYWQNCTLLTYYVSLTKYKNNLKSKERKVPFWMFWFSPPPAHNHNQSSYFSLSVWMSATSGKKYVDETKAKIQEGQRARTEARRVELKLVELERRIAELEQRAW